MDEGFSDEANNTLLLCGNQRFVTVTTNVRRMSLSSAG